MKLLAAIVSVVTVLAVAIPFAPAQNPAIIGPQPPQGGKDTPITIWILSYQRKDANPLADKVFLPKQIPGALDKLKEKGAKKMQFNFKYNQLNVWMEGAKVASVEDIRAAFPGLELKPIASAQFGGEEP